MSKKNKNKRRTWNGRTARRPSPSAHYPPSNLPQCPPSTHPNVHIPLWDRYTSPDGGPEQTSQAVDVLPLLRFALEKDVPPDLASSSSKTPAYVPLTSHTRGCPPAFLAKPQTQLVVYPSSCAGPPQPAWTEWVSSSGSERQTGLAKDSRPGGQVEEGEVRERVEDDEQQAEKAEPAHASHRSKPSGRSAAVETVEAARVWSRVLEEEKELEALQAELDEALEERRKRRRMEEVDDEDGNGLSGGTEVEASLPNGGTAAPTAGQPASPPLPSASPVEKVGERALGFEEDIAPQNNPPSFLAADFCHNPSVPSNRPALPYGLFRPFLSSLTKKPPPPPFPSHRPTLHSLRPPFPRSRRSASKAVYSALT
ncbi:hypothetical protein JCM10213_008574 [Rhodosporidiobolus nylandii]